MIHGVAPAGACCAEHRLIALQREYIAMQYHRNKGLRQGSGNTDGVVSVPDVAMMGKSTMQADGGASKRLIFCPHAEARHDARVGTLELEG
jgi:hypothetical protein